MTTTDGERAKSRGPLTAAAAAAALLLAPAGAAGQGSGGDVLRTALDRYEERLRGIEAVEIVQRTTLPMGGATTTETRLVRDTVGGRTVLVPAEGRSGGQSSVTRLFALFQRVSDRAELRGRETVDGEATHRVAVDRLQELDVGAGALSGGPGEAFRADSASLYLDVDDYVLRRADVWGSMEMGGRRRSVSATARFRDFREVEGFVHPYRTEARVSVEGVGEQVRRMMEGLEESEADSARRAAMEEAVGALTGGEMAVTVVVRQLRVNPGAGGRDG